ncbi:uncharacterized protein LOC117332288 [Pecten maximus]|uniref:uncharacterized protein LOC117332288 n=1 Tax=Pecten maximus TaxID=6579 RepID=UPI0014582BF3|nr:uncharacterized protein LOC117332288 [Pecten maximus]
MTSNCTGEGRSTIGIDRTFNLGKCFVTTMTYKNQGVVQTKTGENPIMLRYLEKTGTPETERKRIIKIIFGTDGLAFTKNDDEYLTRRVDLEPYLAQNSQFDKYWTRYLEHKIKAYVIAPLRQGTIEHLWTNNNSESMNNRIKQAADFKQHKLPDF